REHYIASAEAYLRGIERRITVGMSADVASVASVFISRWDAAVLAEGPPAMANPLGIAIRRRCYKAYPRLVASPRHEPLVNNRGRPQRLLFASTGTKDPHASDVLYVKAFAAPLTVNTIPEATLRAFAAHGEVDALIPADGGDCEAVIAAHANAGIDVDALAAQ